MLDVNLAKRVEELEKRVKELESKVKGRVLIVREISLDEAKNLKIRTKPEKDSEVKKSKNSFRMNQRRKQNFL